MRKRGKRFARRVDPGAALHTIAMQHGMADDQLRDLGLAVHAAIERMRIGHGIEQDFHTLAAAVNVSLILCERGVGAEHLGTVTAAQDALVRVWARGNETRRWAFDGSGLQAVNAAVALHEQQIAAVPRTECRDAMLECRRRVVRGDVLNAKSTGAARHEQEQGR